MEENVVGAQEDSAKSAEAPTQAAAEPGVASSTTDYSKTNLQKVGVEEPEIIKTDGKYIYYYNQTEQKIYVVRSPLNQSTSTINLKNASIITIINVPDGFYGVQLFVTKTRLVILGSKYSNENYYNSLLNRYQSTSLAIYDTTNISSLKLLKYVGMD
jgi:inhibitor of cysteine peptidase